MHKIGICVMRLLLHVSFYTLLLLQLKLTELWDQANLCMTTPTSAQEINWSWTHGHHKKKYGKTV